MASADEKYTVYSGTISPLNNALSKSSARFLVLNNTVSEFSSCLPARISKLSINHPEYDPIYTLHLPSIATRVACFRSSQLASGAQGCNRAADSQLQLTFDLAK